MPKTKPFDEHLSDYEQWFIENHHIVQSELEALQTVIPVKCNGVEIGVGSGIFASLLGIKDGVEPSFAMREKAKERYINAINGVAEKLPYANKSYEYALMITTLCFVDDISQAFREVKRILKNDGKFIIGFVDKDSPIGKIYLENKDKDVFYKDAVFYSVNEVYKHLWEIGFRIEETWQTLFGHLNEITKPQSPVKGFGNGSFVVIKAIKNE